MSRAWFDPKRGEASCLSFSWAFSLLGSSGKRDFSLIFDMIPLLLLCCCCRHVKVTHQRKKEFMGGIKFAFFLLFLAEIRTKKRKRNGAKKWQCRMIMCYFTDPFKCRMNKKQLNGSFGIELGLFIRPRTAGNLKWLLNISLENYFVVEFFHDSDWITDTFCWNELWINFYIKFGYMKYFIKIVSALPCWRHQAVCSWTLRLDNIGTGQYLNERLFGNTLCCRYVDWISKLIRG